MAAVVSTYQPDAAQSVVSQIKELEWVAAVNMHHDAITGTSKAKVMDHYLIRQNVAIRKSRLLWRPLLDVIVEPRVDESKVAEVIRFEVQDPYQDSLDDYYLEQITSSFKLEEKVNLEEFGWDFSFESPSEEAWYLRHKPFEAGEAQNEDMGAKSFIIFS